MNKLKTLIDLKYCVGAKENKDATYLYKTVDINELRNESIKWIKELEWYEKNGHIEFEIDGYWFNHKNEVIKWIKYFFNITNDDLE